MNLREELRFCNEQLTELQRGQSNGPETSQTVQSIINRAEREKAVLQSDLARLRTETDILHDRWLEASEALRNERDRATNQQEEFEKTRRRLECECNLLANQHTTAAVMRRKLNEMEATNRQLETEIVQLKTAYQQLK